LGPRKEVEEKRKWPPAAPYVLYCKSSSVPKFGLVVHRRQGKIDEAALSFFLKIIRNDV
jgi:hypothetical protein